MTNLFRPSPQLALILITMIWGGTFLTVQTALDYGEPLYFIAIRFGSAAIFMAFILRQDLFRITRQDVLAGTFIGVFLFLGYTLQTYGLKSITSSKSAFITAFAVPLIPVLQWIVFKERPRFSSWIGIALAFAGLILIAGPSGGEAAFSIGVILTILSAIAVALEVILIGWYAGKIDVRRVTFLQLLVASVIATVLIPVMGEPVPHSLGIFAGLAILLGLASAVIQATMNWAQKSLSPTRATIIYSAEPVWAGIIGRIAGERLPSAALVGAALIISAMLISELSNTKKDQ